MSAYDYKSINGRTYATILPGNTIAPGHVGYYDENTSAWVLEATAPGSWTSHPPLYLTKDSSDNVYAGFDSFWKSSDGGATWSCPFAAGGSSCNAAADVGGASGLFTFWTPKVYGGKIYEAGEFPLVSYDLPGFTNLVVGLRLLTYSCTDPDCYVHNVRGIAADGNETTGAQSEMLALADRCINYPTCTSVSAYIQRWDIASSPSAQVWVTPTVPATLGGWLLRKIINGTNAHEYYTTGGAVSSATGTGVYGSVDGGVTWSTVGQLFTTNSNNQTEFSMLEIGPDDSKLIARQGSGSIPADVWFHDAPATATASTLNGGAKVQGKVVIQ